MLCSAQHPRHTGAVAARIAQELKQEHGKLPRGTEGKETGRWVLLDFGDLLVHVFERNQRGHYDLDGLWSDAPRVSMADLDLAEIPDVGRAPSQPFTTATG